MSEILWATEEEVREHFRSETFEHPLPGKITYPTSPIPGRPGWRVDSVGREWYSAVWLNPS